jgi:UDP-glucose 4-epimerase
LATHLILGGSGFLGRHVAARLVHRGETVIIGDRTPFPTPSSPLPPKQVSFARLDLIAADWDALVASCDVVHHYAWSTIPQTANENPIADLETNVRSTLALLDALRRRGGKRLIFASSGGTVYGKPKRIPVSEDHPLNPITAYGVSKVAVEKYLGFYRESYGLDCRIARMSNPFGAGQDPRRNLGAVTNFLGRALNGEKLMVWGDGEIIRDYIHVSDVTNGLIAVATASLDQFTETPVFNIASGKGLSLNQIISAIESKLGRSLNVQYVAGRAFDVPVNVLDVTRAEEILGWRPRLSFEQGLELAATDLQRNTPFSTLL